MLRRTFGPKREKVQVNWRKMYNYEPRDFVQHAKKLKVILSRMRRQTVYVILILIIFINCNWVVTRWQWLFYMYTKHKIGYY